MSMPMNISIVLEEVAKNPGAARFNTVLPAYWTPSWSLTFQ